MKKLVIILGMVLLSRADALAANAEAMEGARLALEVYRSPSDSLTQLNSIYVGKGSDSLIQHNGHHFGSLDVDSYLIVAGVEPGTRPGNPDNRGGQGDKT